MRTGFKAYMSISFGQISLMSADYTRSSINTVPTLSSALFIRSLLNLYMSLVLRKPAFCICEKKTQISFAVTAKLISAFVFATQIVQSLYFLNPKFQASSHLLWLHSPVCIEPGRKPRRFSQNEAHIILDEFELWPRPTTHCRVNRPCMS